MPVFQLLTPGVGTSACGMQAFQLWNLGVLAVESQRASCDISELFLLSCYCMRAVDCGLLQALVRQVEQHIWHTISHHAANNFSYFADKARVAVTFGGKALLVDWVFRKHAAWHAKLQGLLLGGRWVAGV